MSSLGDSGSGENSAAKIRFGFTGKESFPIQQGISLLQSADLNGDGLLDIVVANNARSKINLLYNQTGKEKTDGNQAERQWELNELPPDARFRIDSIASEKRIAALQVADINSDDRPDLVYYGEPKELIVQYNEGNENWGVPERWSISEGVLNPNGLLVGDLNDDERPDLLLLGENEIFFLAQNEKHLLSEPKRIPFSGSVKGIQILDVNGDERQDLLMVNWDSEHPIRLRLQNRFGKLGPEVHFTLPPIRAYWADDLNHDQIPEIVTIARNSGRVQLAHLTQQDPKPLPGKLKQGQFEVLPLNRSSNSERGLLWSDLNSDGRPDLLAAEPKSGEITLYRQQAHGQFAAPQSFPSLTDIRALDAADWDQDDQNEIFLLSSEEREVGVTKIDKNGRIPFPRIIPAEGRPLALTAGRIFPSKKAMLALLVRDEEDRRILELRSSDGEIQRRPLSPDFKSTPSTMAIHDLDQDGLQDIFFLSQYQKIKVLRQRKGGGFEELNVSPPGGSSAEPWMSQADIDGDGPPELLLAKDNFVRAVKLDKTTRSSEKGSTGWTLKVKEQINGAASNSRITGAGALASNESETPYLFLLDSQKNALTLCEQNEAGVWKVSRTIELPVSQFSKLEPVKIGSSKGKTMTLLGAESVAWMHFQGKLWQYKTLDGYETPIQDARLRDVISGDLNDDGQRELVFLETKQHHIDIVRLGDGHQLLPGNRWQVFEKRSFRNRGRKRPEPREAVIADFTNDAKDDLVIIVHDRVLLYPQD